MERRNTRQTKRSYQAPALEKGLDIIEFLSLQAASQSLTEIAQALGRSHNEIYRMLACLEERRYVMRDEHSGKYYLSLKLFQLSHNHSPLEFLRNAAISPMRHLTETVKQACHLAVIFEDSMMVAVRVRSPLAVSLSIEEGTRFPIMSPVSGRLLLAFSEPALRNEILARQPDFQKMSKREQQAYERELERIRAQGHLIAPSWNTEGVTDIGVPVGAPGSQVFAALTLPCIKTLSAVSDQQQVLAAALTCAQAINSLVGLAWPPSFIATVVGGSGRHEAPIAAYSHANGKHSSKEAMAA